jgi:glycosyltransferase involved in cell wall biosynthesis
MALWMDMTNTLVMWQGGVVGIVRTELEIAKNLKKLQPDLRISVYRDGCFEEIPEKKLAWLWNANTVTEAYLSHFGRKTGLGEEDAEKSNAKHESEYAALAEARRFSTSHVVRLKQAGRLFIKASPLPLHPLLWLFWLICTVPLTIASKLFNALRHYKLTHPGKHQKVKQKVPKFTHPYQDGDKIFSMGWYGSGKERGFMKVRDEESCICLVYLIYDLVLLNRDTTIFYSIALNQEFRKYYEWALFNCDYLLYLGDTAKKDSEEYQHRCAMPITPGFSVRFGSDIISLISEDNIERIKSKYGISTNFILTVGTLDPRKNYDTLYRAYAILSDKYKQEIPCLVIVGATHFASDEYNIDDIIKNDPKTKELIKIIQPNDSELDLLYENCDFAVLPSLYEGRSVVLSEILSHSKFCIAVDIPPIREIGGELISYIPKNDAQNPFVWADKLAYLFNNKHELSKHVTNIRENYSELTWANSAIEIGQALEKCSQINGKGNLYFDLTLTFHQAFNNGSITGILRSELLLLRLLSKIRKGMKYFAILSIGYVEINRLALEHLLSSSNLEWSFDVSKQSIVAQASVLFKSSTSKKDIHADSYWMFASSLPACFRKKLFKLKKYIGDSNKILNAEFDPIPIDKITEFSVGVLELPFKKDDVIFSPGIGGQPQSYANMLQAKKKNGFMFAQTMYDFTPILVPQTHQEMTIKHYTAFAEYVAKIADLVLYGGTTAMRDGEEYYRKMGWPVPKGVPIKWGSNINSGNVVHTAKHDKKKLEELDIEDDFIIIVGTWEYRKNHVVLYNAYIRMLEHNLYDDIPQLVFCGRSGWKTAHMIRSIMNDARLRGKIQLRSPSDEQLDVLYRHCKFSVLPSLYEGWSLTLPESMHYGKFVIAADVDPLRETGGEFCDYVHPYDVAGWAKKIHYYYNNPDALKTKEEKIKKGWHSVTWAECAEDINRQLTLLEGKI